MHVSTILRGIAPLLAAGLVGGCSFDTSEGGAAAAVADSVTIDESGNGGTFDVVEGQLVVVRLSTNPSTGYQWQVTSTDRTFGYPATAEVEPGQGIGSPGTAVMTWQTEGFLSMVGQHSVELSYVRPWEEGVEPERTFSFTVDVQAKDATGPLVIDESGDGQTVTVVEGRQVQVRLPANYSTGYRWIVAQTDRTFGYPATDEYLMHQAPEGALGSGGTQILTWETAGFLPMVGLHSVKLEYRRPWDENVDPAREFGFSVDIVAADQPADSVVIDESGDGQLFTATEGQPVVVRLSSNASTGYRWIVASTDRTFGYPSSDEMEAQEGGPIGSGGTQVLTWQTTGFLPMVGTHAVTLEYRRPWDENVDPERTFTFSVEIVPGDGGDDSEVALSLNESDDGGFFEVAEGGDIEVRLPSNPSTGYDWVVTRTDRTFGYPEITYEPASDAIGSGGTTVLTWKTSGSWPMVGTHAVELGYRRSWDDEETPSAQTFSFTVEITE